MSTLQEKMAAKQFVVTTELTPPKGTDVSELTNKARQLKSLIDAINVTDSPNSHMSLSPLAASHLLVDCDVEPIMQVTTRDRNRIALQADILAASVLGVGNLVCMGGDPPHLGDHPDAKPVFDLKTEELISAVNLLNHGSDFSGNKLNQATDLHLGAVVNPGADDLDTEISRLEDKIAAGATFFQTQAIYDSGKFIEFMKKIAHLNVCILAGILPIKSVRMAEHMNNNVPGISIPRHMIDKIDKAGTIKPVSAELAATTISEISGHCQGIHLMTLGWEDQIAVILEKAGVK